MSNHPCSPVGATYALYLICFFYCLVISSENYISLLAKKEKENYISLHQSFAECLALSSIQAELQEKKFLKLLAATSKHPLELSSHETSPYKPWPDSFILQESISSSLQEGR